jgi:hypothetical protein
LQLQLQRRFAQKDRLSDDVARLQEDIEKGLRVEARPLLGLLSLTC